MVVNSGLVHNVFIDTRWAIEVPEEYSRS
ncbi:Protein CBG27091 [Caenorhabditis briggsae]|uniref:Protein CBG27091 n=1 Tax=Caenorhabditis briggsae TaxID=6238 RepID=B6IHG7_CAEBR|nr:Protein CBG27091 [Caenorhabditis briggsae]CAR99347.1 Protein CBG27091 [Caenorhabditis briggsae]